MTRSKSGTALSKPSLSGWRLLLASALLALSGCAAAPDPGIPPVALIAAGERVALENCGECHAVGDRASSALADAPPFRSLQARYSRDQMAALLARRMVEIHPRMPLLTLDDDQIQSLLDYWETSGPRND